MRQIQHVTSAKCKHFDKLFQHHQQQLLAEVGTVATGPRRTFPTKLVHRRSAAEEEVYGVVNITANKRVEFHVSLSDAATEAITWTIADME